MDMLDMSESTRNKKNVYNYEMLTNVYRFFSNIYKLCSVLLHHAGEVPVADPVVIVGQVGPVILLDHGGHVKRVVGRLDGRGRARLGGGGEVGGGGGHAGHLVVGGRVAGVAAAGAVPSAALLLGLHPPVLEPDLDLSLSQTQSGGQFQPPGTAEVSVVVIFLLQLHQLPGLEGGAGSLGGQAGVVRAGRW